MARRYRQLLTVELLNRRYVAEEATVVEIAAETGASAHAVYDALKRHRIALRGVRRPRHVDYSRTLTKAYLLEHYVDAQKSLEDIAVEVGCTPATVSRWLHRHGIDARPARALQPRVYPDLVVDPDVASGDVAARTGAARSTVNAAYQRAGVRRRSGRRRQPLDTARIDELHRQGWSQRAIADAVGCSPGLVWKYLNGRRPPLGDDVPGS